MDTTALDALPELYRQARDAAAALAALIAAAAPAAEIAFAGASLDELRAALDRHADEVIGGALGLICAARRQGAREERQRLAAEQARRAAATRPPVRLASG